MNEMFNVKSVYGTVKPKNYHNLYLFNSVIPKLNREMPDQLLIYRM